MITVSGLGAAILIAEMELGPFGKPRKFESAFLSEESSFEIDGKAVPCTRLTPNPNYKKESREERRERELIRIQKVGEFLKTNYSKTDFYERFMALDSTVSWLNDLPYHTTESLSCRFLNKDKHHCDKNRDTSCYTCCFECFQGCKQCSEECCALKKI